MRILDEGFGADFDIFCVGSVRERTRFVGAIVPRWADQHEAWDPEFVEDAY